MQKLLPTHWHLATWIAAAIWLYWAIPSNWPLPNDVAAPFAEMADQHVKAGGNPQHLDPNNVPTVHFYRRTGFPFAYSNYRLLSEHQAQLEFHSLPKLTCNVLLS